MNKFVPQIDPIFQSFYQYLDHKIAIEELQKTLAGYIAVLETDIPFEIRTALVKMDSELDSICVTMSADKQNVAVRKMLANLEKTIQSAA